MPSVRSPKICPTSELASGLRRSVAPSAIGLSFLLVYESAKSITVMTLAWIETLAPTMKSLTARFEGMSHFFRKTLFVLLS